MNVDWAVLGAVGVFMAAMIGVGAWASRRQKTAADFYVGGRKFGTLTTTATQIASAFGGGMLVAHVGLGYAYGLAEMVYMTALALGILSMALLVARWLRQQDFYTTADWMARQYGAEGKKASALRGTTSLTAMLVTFSWWVSQPIAAGKVMYALTGLPVRAGIVIAAAVVTAYTLMGGIIAVAYTDVLQLILMLLGMTVLFPMVVDKAGGITEILSAVPPDRLTLWAPGKAVVLGWILAVLPGQMVLQLYHQRIYAAADTSVARRGLFTLAGACILAGIWATLLGMALYKLNPALSDKDAAMTWCVTTMLPPVLGTIVVGTIVAAIVSTADSALHSCSASITRDFYQQMFNPDATDKDILRFSKITIAVLGVVGAVIGVVMPSIIGVLVMGYTLTASGLFVPLYVGRYWKRATRQGAMAGMIAGVGIALLFSVVPALGKRFPAIGAGLIGSLAGLVLGSYVFTRPVRADARPKG